MENGVKRSDSDHREHYEYMVTIKNNSIKYTPLSEVVEVYESLVKRIRHAEWYSRYGVELDSLGRIHIHAMFKRPIRINIKVYRKKGWTIHFQLIRPEDIDRVYGYITKETTEPSQLNIESFCRYHNIFTLYSRAKRY